ncbi:hypothetical protein DUI87_24437 [Hirundo rustica rustica]|uniref:Uncharacterized protein n=1 Tax=Hirundo rustica rustica TaxID=333673 RepID=A0A3M0JIQ0_HIRRU|nr:hypothetical protein DUI87_24437 [Hirundo rustica rustica]
MQLLVKSVPFLMYTGLMRIGQLEIALLENAIGYCMSNIMGPGLENTKKKKQGEPPNTVDSSFRVYN